MTGTGSGEGVVLSGDDAASLSAARFEHAFGHPPDAVVAAPGRVNLIGEFTDYNGGRVLPFALDRRTVAAVAAREDATVVVSSSARPRGTAGRVRAADPAELVPGSVRGWGAYPLGVAWAMRDAGLDIRGVELHLDSDVPVGAGLSSSAALEVAVAMAIDAVSATGCGRAELAAVARRAENDFVGVPTGVMDQLASLCCEAGHALLLDTRSGATEQVPFAPAEAGMQLLVINTGVRHELASSAYGDRRRTCEEAAAMLGVAALRDLGGTDLGAALRRLPDPVMRRRVRHVVTEDARVIDMVRSLGAGDYPAVGATLQAAHRSLRDDFEVSCPELDLAVDSAVRAGAYGSRMIGGGFGGCAIALVDADGGAELAGAVTDAFARAGFATPTVFPTAPAGGATRLR